LLREAVMTRIVELSSSGEKDVGNE
jgi:hypothetical protein